MKINLLKKYFSVYMGNREGFVAFHNNVINMPRDEFSSIGIKKIKILAGYLLLTKNKANDKGINYKYLINIIKEELDKGNYPKERDKILESKYFEFQSLDEHYKKQGRMIRHLMGFCAFWGFIKSISKNNKIVDYDKCSEYVMGDDSVLDLIARNNLIMLKANTNDFIKSLRGININDKIDYRPTFSILRYMKEISRNVTAFELSILFGRIDEIKGESCIMARALDIGRIDEIKGESCIMARALDIGRKLPIVQKDQICYVFSNMGWKNEDGVMYPYARSQEPYFKFKSYLLFMMSLGLIEYVPEANNYKMTEYAIKILSDDVSYLVVDLENLIREIENGSDINKELNDLILYQRNPELLNLVKSDPNFYINMNKRSINNPIFNKEGKRVRNRLIAELAKIKAEYKCQYESRHIFKMQNGKYYCEAHHIIEFSQECGPDITDNLVVLGPESHTMLHKACRDVVDNVYIQLIKNGALGFERFENMASIYKCLTPNQIDVLHSKKIITDKERDKLLLLLGQNN